MNSKETPLSFKGLRVRIETLELLKLTNWELVIAASEDLMVFSHSH